MRREVASDGSVILTGMVATPPTVCNYTDRVTGSFVMDVNVVDAPGIPSCFKDGRDVKAQFHIRPGINWPAYSWSMLTVPALFWPIRQVELLLHNADGTILYPLMLGTNGSLIARKAIPSGTDLLGATSYAGFS